MKRVNRRSCRAPPARSLDHSRGGDVSELGRDVSIAPDFGSRLSGLVELQGAAPTADELSQVGECFPQCRGKEHWEVREYVGLTGVGAREYRVVRGSRVQHVYRSAERARADGSERTRVSGKAPGRLSEGPRMNLPWGRIAHRHE
jgi:hypothetical protein